MSAQISPAADIGAAARPPDEPDQDDGLFSRFVGEVLAADEIISDLGAYSRRREQLSDHLLASRAELVGGVSAERKRWNAAAERADHPRDAVEADHKPEKTWVYRFLFLPLLGLLVTSAGSAALCLFVGYLAASSRPSLASWRPAGLISVAVCAGTFVVAVIMAQLNISWVANREAGTYKNAANLALSEYADLLKKRIMGEARSWINKNPDRSRDHSRLTIIAAPGLAEVYNRAYQVPCEASRQLAALMEQLSGGGTIGLAGPRGAGKTSLIREHNWDTPPGGAPSRNLSLLVSAPVEYQPNDFVLYLLFSLCGAYLKFRGADEDDRSDAATRLHRLRAFRSRRSQLADVAQPSGGNHDKLIREARSYRKQIQAQQSRTTTFGAGLSTPGNIASTSGQVATTATDLPWNYPELVSTFSSFLQEVALELRGPDKENAAAQEVRGRVIIGIDELDKISDAEQAQRFVNELKVVLGVPYCHYLISISDDALAAYEMRGLPVRDAFDSAFDEVIHVRYLNLDGSRELLALRVIGMSDPFISLCHCLSGGLPRDLIRSARHVVITARRLTESGFDRLDAVCQQLVLEELRRKLDASWINRAGGRLGRIDSELLHSIQRLVAYQPDSGESPVDCDLRTGRTLRTELGPIVAGRPLAGPPPAAPPAAGPPAAGPPEPAAVPELACYLHYLLTLLEVFTPALSADGTIVDTRGRPAPDALFNQLCLARQTLGTDPRWSWLTVETFRETWGLEPRYPYPDRS